MKRLLATLALLSCALSAACSNPGATASATDGGAPDLAPSNPLVQKRPYDYDVPSAYDPAKPTPLVVLLHGYSANGYVQAAYFGLTAQFIDDKGFLFAYPNGTRDSQHNLFWNATDACCDFDHTGVDDVAYIDAVIDDMSAHFNVDKKRVFVTGHSNGGFMSHRYACDRASRVAAILALAGDDWLDDSKCKPSEPVAVLQVHGDMDESVLYLGTAAEPSARASVASWAKLDGCTLGATDTTQPPLDLDGSIDGKETTIERWTGCKTGGAAELWTIHGGKHLPSFRQPVWAEAVWGWLAAHPKP